MVQKTFNESNEDKLSKFHKEYEKLCNHEGLGNHELLVEIGQLTLEYDLTKDDVSYILNNFNCKFDTYDFLKCIWEDWDNNLDDGDLWDELLNKISEYSLPRDYHTVINILKGKYDITRKK